MAENALGLFGMTPESLMAARQAALQKQAQDYASLSPMQQGISSIYQAGGNLGSGLAGLMGIQDPELERVKQMQEFAKTVDSTTPEGLMKAAQSLLQAGRPQEANALVRQAQAMQLQAAQIEKEQSIATKNAREKQLAGPAELQVAARVAQLKAAQNQLAGLPESPEVNQAKAQIQSELEVLTKPKDVTPSELGKLLSERSKFAPGTPEYVAYTARITKLSKEGGLGAEIAAGLAPLVAATTAKKAAEASGTAVGKGIGENIAQIPNKQEAEIAVSEALKLLDKGIYTGKYGKMAEEAAGYSLGAVGDTTRLSNTEQFRAYVGETVVPRLKEFGGNDSEQELAYLRQISGGDTAVQEATLRRILKSAEAKIKRGIKLAEQQAANMQKGTPLKSAAETPAQPVRRRVYDPVTKSFN